MIFDKFKKLKKYDPEADRRLREDIEAAGGAILKGRYCISPVHIHGVHVFLNLNIINVTRGSCAASPL